MSLEETLEKIVEAAREEFKLARKRSEEKTPPRDHGHDFHEMQAAADHLDHYAAAIRKLHDNEFPTGWRQHSAS